MGCNADLLMERALFVFELVHGNVQCKEASRCSHHSVLLLFLKRSVDSLQFLSHYPCVISFHSCDVTVLQLGEMTIVNSVARLTGHTDALHCPTNMYSTYFFVQSDSQSDSQSINQLVNQSINQPLNQSVNQSFVRWFVRFFTDPFIYLVACLKH